MDESNQITDRIIDIDVDCPACRKKGRKSRSAFIIIGYSSDWIDHFVFDCAITGSHDFSMTGSWDNPLVKWVLLELGLTKKRILKVTPIEKGGKNEHQ